MRNKFSILLFTFLFSFSLIAAGYCQGLIKDDINFKLPDEWFEIPRNILDQFESYVVKLSSNKMIEHYNYGFQLTTSKNWLEYPYILIQVKNTGRLSKRKLESYEKVNLKKYLTSAQKSLSEVLYNLSSNKMIYDEINNIVWAQMDAKVANVGMIKCLAAMIPTKNGVIQAFAYAKESDYTYYQPIFERFILSIEPAPNNIFKP